MLWYKAWLETRSRFLASLFGITIIISFFVHHGERLFPPGPKTATYSVIFFAHQYLVGIWILSVILLGWADSFVSGRWVHRRSRMHCRLAGRA